MQMFDVLCCTCVLHLRVALACCTCVLHLRVALACCTCVLHLRVVGCGLGLPLLLCRGGAKRVFHIRHALCRVRGYNGRRLGAHLPYTVRSFVRTCRSLSSTACAPFFRIHVYPLNPPHVSIYICITPHRNAQQGNRSATVPSAVFGFDRVRAGFSHFFFEVRQISKRLVVVRWE
jgi:hypothetical protein